MGWFDALRGVKHPPSGMPIATAAALREVLLGLGAAEVPFQVRVTAPDEPGELVAELKIVDARWLEVFATAGLEKAFAIFMRIDAMQSTVLALERTMELEWRAGVPSPRADARVQWGRQMQFDAAVRFGFRPDMTLGTVYRYRFSSADLKRPLQSAALANGWSWQAVGPGGL